jgi:uracil-DNA glycosylase
MSLDEQRRLRYLEAMGIGVWRLRQPPAPAFDQSPAPAAGEPPEPVAAPAATLPEGGEGPPRADISSLGWEALAAAVAQCRACGLCQTRTQTVFGVGDPRAALMVIGEAPGADEDLQGEPFVGRAGQLLNLMLRAIGLGREQVYIANILKCRPPGNRDPRPEEALRCEPYLMRQIALIRPRVILSAGRISAQHLLKTTAPIGELRGRWFELGPDRIPLMVTYHPAYLLRSPEQKARAWQDLQAVWHRLQAPPGSSPRADPDDR